MATLERGFKSWCERSAGAVRVELGLDPHAPLPARSLADHLGINIITPHDIPDLPVDVLEQLTVVDPTGWSAVSFTENLATTIIFNPRNSLGRQSSDIMHELAHVILKHEPSQLIFSESGALAMRSFDAQQEDEANWFGWTLLLPRNALAHCAARQMNSIDIANEYGVSTTLVTFRRGKTGVDLQSRRRKGK